MFKWNADMVRFLSDAASRSSYYEDIAELVRSSTPGAETICDAGCGLGHLSCALSPLYREVTAADISPFATDAAGALKHKRALSNISVIQKDLTVFSPDHPFDSMVFCFYGCVEDVISIGGRCCSGQVIMIKKDYDSHRFSPDRSPVGWETADTSAALLDSLHIPYRLTRHRLEFGQPLRSLSDAVQFFRTYAAGTDPALISAQSVLPRLTETGDPEFPLYVPQERSFGLFVLSSDDLRRHTG